jgi:phosphohistidine phosphatase SixA
VNTARARFRLLVLIQLAAILLPGTAAAQNVFVEPGDVVLVRHANAPGVGDPPGLKLDDCATQRNLDDTGRAEARKLGDEFLARHLRVGAVLTSQWCRTRETARIAFGADKVRDEPAFNSFFGGNPAANAAQTARAREILKQWAGPGVLVAVTHQVNILALASVPAATVEMVVMRKDAGGELRVVGSIRP